MKKLVSVLLVLVLVLSVGTLAFADSGAVHVTKSPTDEVRFVGDTATFTSAGTGYSELAWSFVSPDEKTVTVQEFRTLFPYAVVEGENTITLKVRNLSTAMNGWSVFCAFTNGEEEIDTTLAFLYVSVYSAPATAGTTSYTYLYCDEYGYYMPAHPDAYVYEYYDYDDYDDGLWVDEYGTFTPAHPDPYDYDDYDDGLWADEYGTFTPAHPDAYDYDDYDYDDYDDGLWADEFGTFTPAHPDAD